MTPHSPPPSSRHNYSRHVVSRWDSYSQNGHEVTSCKDSVCDTSVETGTCFKQNVQRIYLHGSHIIITLSKVFSLLFPMARRLTLEFCSISVLSGIYSKLYPKLWRINLRLLASKSWHKIGGSLSYVQYAYISHKYIDNCHKPPVKSSANSPFKRPPISLFCSSSKLRVHATCFRDVCWHRNWVSYPFPWHGPLTVTFHRSQTKFGAR